ncbi:unnamed protein product [Phytophthora fragariaefolia]|uniref:Unnamed protein product n=1 Tax=Phytophthora fragariaefolia TaxID=1490495 RepID=A0A9W6TV21_9STRA|nr:unnamed protein product [Phytophthora fragariaefolia]
MLSELTDYFTDTPTYNEVRFKRRFRMPKYLFMRIHDALESNYGQDSNRYLILDIDMLPLLHNVTCNPFGEVRKGDLSIDAQIIHDLFFPSGDDNTDSDHEVDVGEDGPKALHRPVQAHRNALRSHGTRATLALHLPERMDLLSACVCS